MKRSRGKGHECSPSDDIEAPESLKSSDPIWMGKTLPDGRMSGLPRGSTTRLGVETSMTRPCGPVPLLGSLRLCVSLVDGAVFSGATGPVMDAGREAAGAGVADGEAAEVTDDARDVACRLDDFSSNEPFGPWETPESGSESAFLFIPVWTERRFVGFGGGDSGFCATADCADSTGRGEGWSAPTSAFARAPVSGSGMLKSVAAGACRVWSSCTSSPCGSY